MITEKESNWLKDNSSWIENENTDLETFGNRAYSDLGTDSGMKLAIVFAEARGGHSFYIKSKMYNRYSFYIKMPNNRVFYLYTTEPLDRPLEKQEILLSLDSQVRRLGLNSHKLNNLYRNLQVV